MYGWIANPSRRGPSGRFIAGYRANPSLPKRVQELVRLGATEAAAKRLHRRMSAVAGGADPEAVDAVLEDINVAIGGYGVEAIEGDWHDRYYQNIVALYVNKGDSYVGTVLYNATTNRFVITSVGDFVERNGRRLGVE